VKQAISSMLACIVMRGDEAGVVARARVVNGGMGLACWGLGH
jgi:hypothetical protein